jgi:tRNA A-37 threonylcarbamoyl transferase component Bud32
MGQPSTAEATTPLATDRYILAASAPPLGQEDLAELARPRRERWEIVKHNVSRTVYRGFLGNMEVYLKHFHSRSWLHRLGRRISGGEARGEMKSLLYLRSRGMEVASPLAAGRTGTTEWLATAAVCPAQRADLWHQRQLAAGPAGYRRIRQATVALGRLIGRMHAAGVFHRDLHCGNILVRTDTPQPTLVLMDLHRLHRKRRLSRRSKAANLAQLLHDRWDFTTRSDRLRFLRSYLSESGAGGSLRSWQEEVETFARRHRRQQYARRDRRTLGTGHYFSPIKLSYGWRGHVVLASKRRPVGLRSAEAEFTVEDWRLALRNPEALLTEGPLEVVKDSPSSRIVRRNLHVGPHHLEVFVKQARRKKWWKALGDCLRPSRSIRAFELGHALLTRGVATTLPLASLERRSGPWLRDSILITEAVDTPCLNRFMETHLAAPLRGSAPLTTVQRRQLAQEVLWQLGRLLQRLHDNNFAHRDLKSGNILIHWQGASRPEVVLVDLDGLSRRRFLTARRRFQGLMRLNVSLLECRVVNHAGRLRMLLGYLRRPGGGRVNFKPYWRMLEDWSARKLRQQIRSRRRRQKAARRPAT